MNNYDYPMGADTPDAPWNEVELPDKEIEVTVSVTLSKTVKVKVNDYAVNEGIEEDCYFREYDFSDCDLHKAVEDQVTLPQDLAMFVERMFNKDLNLKAAGMPRYLKESLEDCKGWNVDDFECVKE